MKTLIIILTILLYTSIGFAASLVCDPQVGVTKYMINVLKIDGVVQQGSKQYIVNAESDGSLLYNIDSWAGIVEAELFAGNEYILDGVPQGVWQWSTPPVPFILSVPPKPGQPTSTALTEN